MNDVVKKLSPKSNALRSKMGIGKKITNAVGSALAAPAVAYHGMKERRSGREADILRNVRKYDDAPNFSKGKPTEAFKMRTAADAIRTRLTK